MDFDTLESGSAMLPNSMHLAGQADWQAVTTSPSSNLRFSLIAVILAFSTRWTQ